MKKDAKKWEVLSGSQVSDIKYLVSLLLKNRGIKTDGDKKEFLNPTDPMKIDIEDLGVDPNSVKKAVDRIKLAKKNGEHVIIYGDYDADGITGTATLWETLHDLGVFVLPHIPERFSEGYGLNLNSVKKLKEEDPKVTLIITVDHGITAADKIPEVKKLGIDMIITDHHQKGEKLPRPLALIYTPVVSGSALAWFFSRELVIKFKAPLLGVTSRLELAAIGTIADQLPLTGVNRSIAKYGLSFLGKTKRPGLIALYKSAGITDVGPYEVGFIIAPRINSMGRLRHGLESLRLLCTTDKLRAMRLAVDVGEVNSQRQNIVDKVVEHALERAGEKIPYVIVLSDESYHEGVIGLAAAKLVEKFYRPSIVISKKEDVSKASARSIAGFNIIEAIRKLDKYYIEGGGHPMAAGFSIETKNIAIFTKKINQLAGKILTDDILQRRLRIDCEINFDLLTRQLLNEVSLFGPTGIGNPEPVFISKNAEVLDTRLVGKDGKHVKLKIKQNEHILDSIYFGGGEIYSKLTPGTKVDVVYSLEENVWNGYRNLQLKVKDLVLVEV